jgi:hypothetical protein
MHNHFILVIAHMTERTALKAVWHYSQLELVCDSNKKLQTYLPHSLLNASSTLHTVNIHNSHW